MGGGRNPLLLLRKAKQFRFFGLFFLLIDSKAPQCQTKGKVEESVFSPLPSLRVSKATWQSTLMADKRRSRPSSCIGEVEESVFFSSTVIASELANVAIHSSAGQEGEAYR
jgi:hypothetical protein